MNCKTMEDKNKFPMAHIEVIHIMMETLLICEDCYIADSDHRIFVLEQILVASNF